jgi:hypothetical protein
MAEEVLHGDLRDEYLSRVVRGRTFADVGGLWGTVNEKVSVAHRLGATAVTMIDMQPEGNEWWHRFHERMRSLDISGYQSICAQLDAASGATYDVVHCSGVLYHHPNPLGLLADLRAITRRHLVLTSAITPAHVSNDAGDVQIGASTALFVPALDDAQRRVLAVHWKAAGAEVLGITQAVDYRLDDFGPWWWLPTVDALRAMVAACGLRIDDGGHTWNRNAYTLLCEAI